MNTFFASPQKGSKEEILLDVEIIGQHPITTGLLESVNGLLAIVNSHRQVVAINNAFLEKINIKNPEKTLGLRLGEVLKCVHSKEYPHGCGTTKYCSTCGAAIAMAVSIDQNKVHESICAISTEKNNKKSDLYLSIKSHPIKIYGDTFILLFLNDITKEQNNVALEKVFFHDINNMLTTLLSASEMLATKDKNSKLVKSIYKSSLRLCQEIEIQKTLSYSKADAYKPMLDETNVNEIIKELKSMFENNHLAKNKSIKIATKIDDIKLNNDTTLILRILSNMLTNALEETKEQGIVKLDAKTQDKSICFSVWNDKLIPKDIALRIFQRNFSTKEGMGRGLGTYSMKFFGEEILNGKVSFNSTKQDGTTFFFSLPID